MCIRDRPIPSRARAAALARLGIGVVVVDDSAPGEAPEVAGRRLAREGDLTVLELDDPDQRTAPFGWRIAMALAWAAWLACWVLGAGQWVAARRRVR